MSTEHHFVVPDTLAGARLDRCLAELHSEWSRSRARKLIDQDRVRLNGQPAKPAELVQTGDEVVVSEPLPEPTEMTSEDIPLEILFEDEHLLVVNKPAGLAIHPAAGTPSGTLVNALLHHCNDLSGIGGVERPGIVHRLDKETTGIIVVAKNDRAHRGLSLAFRWRKVVKTYLCVCYGVPTPREGVVDAPVGRHPRHRQQMAVVASGRPSRTLWEVREPFDGVALVACRPVTGRTHQIRVHMAHIGHALVGDTVYSGRQWRNLRDPQVSDACRTFPRQALHAWRLELRHPVNDLDMVHEAPLPADLEALLAMLRSR